MLPRYQTRQGPPGIRTRRRQLRGSAPAAMLGLLGVVVLANFVFFRDRLSESESAAPEMEDGFQQQGIEPSEPMRRAPGCLERPAFGTVISRGLQPDCADRPDLKAATPNRIPKIIHQTYRTLDLPAKLRDLSNTWVTRNPGWEVRHYSDADCRAMVAAEFPDYLGAYLGLPKPVERADFFRYLVVLRYGGVYGDMDTECKVPLDLYLSHGDTLVAGWENEFPSNPVAVKRTYSRQAQLLQWVFAGAPRHPALVAVCDHIRQHYRVKFHRDSNTDTLDRTGPGAWTDAVMSYAPGSSGASPKWPVRLLPQVAFGAFGIDGLPNNSPGALVQHHFSGSWKHKSYCHHWPRFFWWPRIAALWMMGQPMASFKKPDILAPHLMRPGEAPPRSWWEDLYVPHVSGFSWSIDFWSWGSKAQHDACMARLADDPLTTIRDLQESLRSAPHPVSIAWWPAFSMMVHQVGAEAASRADGDDVSAHITAWGLWEAGWIPPMFRGPASVGVLLGALLDPVEPPTALGNSYGQATAFDPALFTPAQGTLIDVAAGPGLFSLAAAARGLRVVAVEPEEGHRRLLDASIKMNGWGDLVSVVEDPVGAIPGAEVCVRRELGLEALEASSSFEAPQFSNNERRWNQTGAALPPWSLAPGERAAACGVGQSRGTQRTLDEVVREYLSRDASVSAGLGSSVNAAGESLSVLRVGHGAIEVVSGASQLLSSGISGPGGLRILPPSLLLLELHAYKLSAAAALVRTLEQTHAYTGGLFHVGALCRKQAPTPVGTPTASAPDGGAPRAAADTGRRWCRCKAGRFWSAISAGKGAYSDGTRSLTLALLHRDHAATSLGEKWLGMMAGAALGSCIV